jgi:hypothetical protein
LLGRALDGGGCLAEFAAFCFDPGGQSGETVGSGIGRVGGIVVRDKPRKRRFKQTKSGIQILYS